MTIEERIETVLETCRPYLRADAGNIQFLRFKQEGGVVEVKWEGTCVICPISVLTLRAGIERALMKALPEVKRVEAVGG